MKAKKMYVVTTLINRDSVTLFSKAESPKHFTPVLMVPLDPASVEETREKLEREIFYDTKSPFSKKTADDILASLGITPPQRKQPLGTKRTEK